MGIQVPCSRRAVRHAFGRPGRPEAPPGIRCPAETSVSSREDTWASRHERTREDTRASLLSIFSYRFRSTTVQGRVAEMHVFHLRGWFHVVHLVPFCAEGAVISQNCERPPFCWCLR